MPIVSEHIDVDFDWDDVITKRLSDDEVAAIADAIVSAGLADATAKAIQNAVVLASKGNCTSARADTSVDVVLRDVDHLIDDYARGMNPAPMLEKIAFEHFGRVLVNVRTTQ